MEPPMIDSQHLGSLAVSGVEEGDGFPRTGRLPPSNERTRGDGSLRWEVGKLEDMRESWGGR